MEQKPSKLQNGVSVIIPVYGAVRKLRLCLDSLALHLPGGCSVYVVDDASPSQDIEPVVSLYSSRFEALRFSRNSKNLGFVKTCNLAWAKLESATDDVLLLNSDTEVTAGFLEEMQEVLYLSDRHAIVCPRSNNATIFSVPVNGRVSPEASFELWRALEGMMVRNHVVPTAVGFCALIKRPIVDNFGLFDEGYSPGYNEENDLVCRINQYGYSVVSANRAFVYHHESSSFGSSKSEFERRNRQILISRYPEYERKVAEYFQFYLDPVEIFAPLLLPHRPRFLFDLSHLPDRHAGTSEFALKLLAHVAPRLEKDWDLYLTVNEPAHAFFANEISGYRFHDDKKDSTHTYDVVFKPCQAFTWQELSRITRLGARVCFTLLDIIGVRCDYLTAASRYFIIKSSVELADAVFTLSEFSRSDFDNYFGFESGMTPILLGATPERETASSQGEYVLIVGNSFRHKAVEDAVRELHTAGPIVVIGGDGADRPGLRYLKSGELTRETMRKLYSQASVVVFPSHYEGFGLPIVEALKHGKPVVAMDTTVNRELTGLYSEGIHLVQSFSQLKEMVCGILRRGPGAYAGSCPRNWDHVAAEYFEAFEQIRLRPIDAELLRRRWKQMRLIQSVVNVG